MTKFDSHIPEYTLEEKKEEIIIVIVAPLSKPKEAAFVLEKDVFTFDSPPYLLKMKLPHPVSDRFSQQAFDNDTKTYKIRLKKKFGIVEEDTDEEDDEVFNLGDHSEGDTAFVNNEVKKQFYGFANKYTNMFGTLYDEFSEVISLPNPDFTGIEQRRNLREKEENGKWSDDHYLADTMETDHLNPIFMYKPPWVTSPITDDFTDDEKEMLADVINKSKLDNLSKENIRLSEFQVVDILFGYAYNKRTTEGDNTVESGWTVNKLSATLSWFEVFEDLKSVILSCYRRSLIFPLYRNWKLTQMIHEDVVNLLKSGPKQVTRSLLEVREIFNESDNRYILNSLYVNDLCNFGHHMSRERCFELATDVEAVSVKKHEVNSDLRLLEVAAHWTLEEAEGKAETKLKDVLDKMAGLNLERSSSGESESEDSDSERSSPGGGQVLPIPPFER